MAYFRCGILVWLLLHDQVISQQCDCKTVRDIASNDAHGWEESCDGLNFLGGHSVEVCRAACCNDQACTVWFRNATGCFHGSAEQCGHLNSALARSDTSVSPHARRSQITASLATAKKQNIVGQVVARGDIVVNASQYLMRCEGLQSKLFRAPTARTSADLMAYRRFALSGIERCRSVCYANPGCTVWQYGATGCSYSTGAVSCSPDAALAAELTAGEHVTKVQWCRGAQSPVGLLIHAPRSLLGRISTLSAVLLGSIVVLWLALPHCCQKSCARESEARATVLQGRLQAADVEEESEVRAAVLVNEEHEVEASERKTSLSAQASQRNKSLSAKADSLRPKTVVQYLPQCLVMPWFVTAPQPLPLPVRSTPQPTSGVPLVQYRPLQRVHVT